MKNLIITRAALLAFLIIMASNLVAQNRAERILNKSTRKMEIMQYIADDPAMMADMLAVAMQSDPARHAISHDASIASYVLNHQEMSMNAIQTDITAAKISMTNLMQVMRDDEEYCDMISRMIQQDDHMLALISSIQNKEMDMKMDKDKMKAKMDGMKEKKDKMMEGKKTKAEQDEHSLHAQTSTMDNVKSGEEAKAQEEKAMCPMCKKMKDDKMKKVSAHKKYHKSKTE